MDANPDPAPPSRLDRLTLSAGYLTVAVALTFTLVLAVRGRWLLAGVFTFAAAVSMFGMWHLSEARWFKGRQLGAEVQERSAGGSGSRDQEPEAVHTRREAKEGRSAPTPVGRVSSARTGP